MGIKAVIFDMGGVIVELGPLTDILGDLPIEQDAFWSRWLKSTAVRAFEMGKIDEPSFSHALG